MTQHHERAERAAAVLDDLDLLEDLLSTARRIPLTPNVVVSEEGLIELLERIRAAIPEAITAAGHLLDDRAAILDEANREAAEVLARAQDDAGRTVEQARLEAERIREVAEQHAAALVADHAIVRDATQRANEELAGAERQAAEVRGEADAYAREVMERLAEHLERALGTVQKGLATLEPAVDTHPARRRHR